MQIEESFRDLKSERYVWVTQQRSNKESLVCLLLIAYLASLCCLIGEVGKVRQMEFSFRKHATSRRTLRYFTRVQLVHMHGGIPAREC